ncbi:hypothetical protein CC1G_06736 [Coprinopsis cinerea okayama7|uniref:Large ribosomal subunit protein bL32m n=1 Tax=Coprinopsis cinerea (strain Okayama-7 / 130 / ATCC MYA-4618 / FGSC 9003) TaxID=240176 RepID=A8N1Q6_COPC7|nr:hypothetical protein CC1G_06736 [Coprinopsis cinerea okayama7\|eukprot:XP_001828750.2 hypothetical protein CC1G_06736 [Coprinopsis cinerea okayama7\
MALALRSVQKSLSLPWARTLLPATALFATTLPRISNWSIQSLLDLFPPVVLAVPKKKVSHSRKAMRSSNKGLKDKQNIVACPGCGSPKLSHHYCETCYSELTRHWKAEKRQNIS